MHNQVREICTNYGKLDVLWFDFSYDTLRGEAWKATELDQYGAEAPAGCHHRQPSRGERRGATVFLAAGNPTPPHHGDFCEPEQMIPPNGIQDVNGNDIAWESCVTMNNHWDIVPTTTSSKPAPMLIKKLVEWIEAVETCF